ncbi:MAG: ABC transporter ATP-binding protein [Ornithinimicrobium sp.]
MARKEKLSPSALRRTLSILRPHLPGNGLVMGGGALALVFEVLFRVLEPWPVKVVVDAVTRSLGADIGEAGPVASTQLLLAAGLATVSIVGLRALCNFLATVAFALVGSRIATALRQRVFVHVTALSRSYHSRASSGDTVQRMISDVGRLQEVAVTAGLPLVVNLFTLVAMAGVMFWLDPLLALVVVVAAAIFVLMSRGSSGKITVASRKTRKSEGDLATVAQETIGAISVVQAYSMERPLARTFQSSNTQSLKDGVQAKRLSAALERRTDVLVGVSTAVVLVVGGTRVVDGAMTPGDLVIFLTYLKTAMKPLRDLAKYVGRIARATASGERVADLLDISPDITSPARPVGIPHVRGGLEWLHVDAHYADAVPVLSDITLRIAPGERVALVGPSGSGKSTLASLLMRLSDPSRGVIRLDGVDLRDLDLSLLRKTIAVVLQDSVLFSGTLAENIRHGNPEATDEQVRQAARLARAEDFILAQAHGYDTVVGERGSTLSGGQRQRIAIARAFVRDATVVVLDEATAGIDDDNAAQVLEAIDELSKGRTTIMVTHDEATARSCDRIVWIEAGQIRFDVPGDADFPLGQTWQRYTSTHEDADR